MTTNLLRGGGADFAAFHLRDSPTNAPLLIWAHGWGQTHASLLPLAQAMRRFAPSLLLDFPGFGASPLPPNVWGTADYADAVACWLAGLPPSRRIWVGHSFGGRVGLQLAARHPQMLAGLFLIAAAGLPPRRRLGARARVATRSWAFRLARRFVPEGPARDRLRERFGSADYRQAGSLRPILVKTVNEDLTFVARAVSCSCMLIYGDRDREAPPELGGRLSRLMPRSRLVVLRGFGHLDILTEGRHQLAQLLSEFLEHLA